MRDDWADGDKAWRPNLFVPGFPKCGTTALCDYLRQHPDIYVSEPKEPNTLAIGVEYPPWLKKSSRVVRPYTRYLDRDAYRRLFEARRRFRYRAEGSQSYIWPPQFPARLWKFAPDAKLIFLIREEKERLLSLYHFGFSAHHEPNFLKWIESRFKPYEKLFLYEAMLSSYYRLFGDSMRVIESRALLGSPHLVMREVFRFLGVKEAEVVPVRSNVNTAKRLKEQERRRVAPLLRLSTDLMTPVRYLRNMADQEGEMSRRLRLGRLNIVRSVVRRDAGHGPQGTGRRSGSHGTDEPIPDDLASLLEKDYDSTLEFCRTRGLLLPGRES